MNAAEDDKPAGKINKFTYTPRAGGEPISLLDEEGQISTDKVARHLGELSPEARQSMMDGFAAVMPAREIYEKLAAGEHTLERPVGSALHKLLDAAQRKDVIRLGDVDDGLVFGLAALHLSPFVIEHNWASAFAAAQDFAEGEYKLPYDTSFFEFRDGGRRVCIVTGDAGHAFFMQAGEHWIAWEWDPVTGPLADQIRAVCVALDAEVAIKETIRASEKLNRTRAGHGNPLIPDYSIVRLARRERASPLAEDASVGSPKRLHFVRGHWRHYETHKTWIKWYLRGDPDLGFIDKHYRL